MDEEKEYLSPMTISESFAEPKADLNSLGYRCEKQPSYKVQVFVSHGYFEYEVCRMEQAMAHSQAIMSTGVYRRSVDENTVEFHTAYKVKVKSNSHDLGSQYGDKFVRT